MLKDYEEMHAYFKSEVNKSKKESILGGTFTGVALASTILNPLFAIPTGLGALYTIKKTSEMHSDKINLEQCNDWYKMEKIFDVIKGYDEDVVVKSDPECEVVGKAETLLYGIVKGIESKDMSNFYFDLESKQIEII
ncbi:MAG: hypothetical protein N4A47_05990 [Clostridia bacterium]|nr:hypothetical protein [Clostridia bacterium]